MIPFADYARFMEMEGLAHNEWAVLNVLCWCWNHHRDSKDYRRCDPGIAAIRRMARLGDTAAREALKGLVAKRKVSRRRVGKKGRNWHYSYTLLFLEEGVEAVATPSEAGYEAGCDEPGLATSSMESKGCAEPAERCAAGNAEPFATPPQGHRRQATVVGGEYPRQATLPTVATRRYLPSPGDGERLNPNGETEQPKDDERSKAGAKPQTPPSAPTDGGGSPTTKSVESDKSEKAKRKKGKVITARYPGFCRLCKEDIAVGDTVRWMGERSSAHESCYAEKLGIPPGKPAPPRAASPPVEAAGEVPDLGVRGMVRKSAAEREQEEFDREMAGLVSMQKEAYAQARA